MIPRIRISGVCSSTGTALCFFQRASNPSFSSAFGRPPHKLHVPAFFRFTPVTFRFPPASVCSAAPARTAFLYPRCEISTRRKYAAALNRARTQEIARAPELSVLRSKGIRYRFSDRLTPV